MWNKIYVMLCYVKYFLQFISENVTLVIVEILLKWHVMLFIYILFQSVKRN